MEAVKQYIYVNQIAFIICAMIGGFTHYLKKYLKKETDVGLFEWYGPQNAAATLYTVIVFLFTMIGALASEIINEHTGFWACLYTGFVTGFSIDAAFNSDAKISDSLKEARNEARAIKVGVIDADKPKKKELADKPKKEDK